MLAQPQRCPDDALCFAYAVGICKILLDFYHNKNYLFVKRLLSLVKLSMIFIKAEECDERSTKFIRVLLLWEFSCFIC